jgi:hypothetical protein
VLLALAAVADASVSLCLTSSQTTGQVQIMHGGPPTEEGQYCPHAGAALQAGPLQPDTTCAQARQLHVTRPSKPSKPSKPAMKPATASSTTSTAAAVGGGGGGSKPTASMSMTPASLSLHDCASAHTPTARLFVADLVSPSSLKLIMSLPLQAPTDIKLAQETVTSLASSLLVQAAASPPPAFPAFVAIPLNDTAKMTPAGGSAGSASAGSSSSSNDVSEPPPPRVL